MEKRSKILKPMHLEPGRFWFDYILLPYGDFYPPSQAVSKAGKGDVLRFFNGPDRVIERVVKIPQDSLCDLLCRMRYGVSWAAAFKKWQSYAILEGHGRDVLNKDFCWLVAYGKD